VTTILLVQFLAFFGAMLLGWTARRRRSDRKREAPAISHRRCSAAAMLRVTFESSW
jgi:hypothetical protein